MTETGPIDRLRAALAGRYAVEGELGRGGMAYVYRAQDLKHQRPVAIKVLRPGLSAVLGVDRFLREIELTARLSHPRILAIFDSGAVDGLLYYVMPLVDGESLRARIERERQLPIDDAIAITIAIASALSYAHTHGVIHRDIKPENILLSHGEVTVADFGIGRALEMGDAEKLTQTGMALGTPEYMSPEQATADPHVDARSDQFALGCVLFEMLVGEAPFRGPTTHAILARSLTEPMPSICTVRHGLPIAVEQVVRRTLEKTPADRYATMAACSGALGKAAAETATTEIAAPKTRRGRWLVLGVVLVVAGWVTGYLLMHPAAPSVAILAMPDPTADHADPSLGPGLANEVGTRLIDAPGMIIAPTASATYFQRKGGSPREIGAALNMRHVLTVTVTPAAGNRLSIVAELFSANDDRLIWRGSYRVDSADFVIALADSIAPQVLTHLDVGLPAATLSEWTKRASRDRAAVLAYQRGRDLVATRPSITSLDSAQNYFNLAIRIDPSYAEAWAGLSDAWGLRAALGAIKPRDGYPKAKEYALRALQLDSTLAEAHIALAKVHLLYEDDLAAGLAEVQRALALDPRYPDAHQFYAVYYSMIGDRNAAIREGRLASALDPYSLIMTVRLGSWLAYAGTPHYDEAERQARTALKRYPGNPIAYTLLTTLYLRQERYSDACRVADSIGDEFPSVEAGFKGYAFGRCDRRGDARRLIARLEDSSKVRFIVSERIAYAFLGLGEKDSAFAWLGKGFDERTVLFPDLLVAFQSDPRWMPLIERRRAMSAAMARGIQPP
ncbi:MAG: protein kinase [Gemmatimonadales bacterium]